MGKFSLGDDSDVSTDDYLVKPELGKKWNEFVKRQKVELNRGGALKETANKPHNTTWYEKNVILEKILDLKPSTLDWLVPVERRSAKSTSEKKLEERIYKNYSQF